MSRPSTAGGWNSQIDTDLATYTLAQRERTPREIRPGLFAEWQTAPWVRLSVRPPVATGPPIMNNPRSDRLNSQEHEALLRPSRGQSGPSPVHNRPHPDAAASAGPFLQGEALFLASLSVIDDTTRQVCRRHHMTGAEAEDFRSDVRLHFIERDYEVLRRFEGRSSLATYVNVVIQRLALDFRNRQWGKWKPSAEARRLGPTAILLERLVTRDGWPVDQAAEALRVNHGIPLDDPLRALCVKLGQRMPSRQLVAETEASDVASDQPGPDVNVVRAEHDFLAKRVQTALERARQALGPEERLILKMRFEDAVPVADIARALHLNQRRLYRTIERLLARLGESLESEGISRADVSSLFAEGILTWSQVRESAAKTGPGERPDQRVRGSWLQKS